MIDRSNASLASLAEGVLVASFIWGSGSLRFGELSPGVSGSSKRHTLVDPVAASAKGHSAGIPGLGVELGWDVVYAGVGLR